MKLSRRNLLIGSTALIAASPARAWFPRGVALGPSLSPISFQGALSGGGEDIGVVISSDGANVITNYDSGQAFILDVATGKWDNLFAQSRVPAAYQTWGLGSPASCFTAYSTYAVTFAPGNPDIIFAVVKASPGGGNPIPGRIWKSTNRGASFVDLGISIATELPDHFMVNGPFIAIDPVNSNIVLVSDIAGQIWRTADGGSTWVSLSVTGGPLHGACATATVASTGNSNTIHLSSVPSTVSNGQSAGYKFFAVNLTNPATSVQATYISSISGNDLTMAFSDIASPFYRTSDECLLGQSATICFDPSSSTTGGFTHGIFISWACGAGGMWYSNDGATSFTQSTGGPAQFKGMSCGADGVLYALDYTSIPPGTSGVISVTGAANNGSGLIRLTLVNTYNMVTGFKRNVSSVGGVTAANGTWPITVIDSTHIDLQGSTFSGSYTSGGSVGNSTGAWKYSSGVWTNLSIDSTSSGNTWATVAADPLNNGHVAFQTQSGNVQLSGDAGSSWYTNTAQTTRSATDVPWLGQSGTLENWMTAGQAVFDTVVSGRLWFSEGIGVWNSSPPVAPGTTPSFAWTSVNNNQQGLIVNQILKMPSGGLLCCCQDRAAMFSSDVTQEPSNQAYGWAFAQLQGFVDNGAGSGTYTGVAGNVLTVTLKLSGGPIGGGSRNLYSTPVNVSANLLGNIGSQISGTTDDVGTYNLNGIARAIPPGILWTWNNTTIVHLWSADYSKIDPSFVVGATTTTLYTSSDGGSNWKQLFTAPVGLLAGAVACQSASNFVWFPTNGSPQYTTDGGVTWANCLFGGSTKTTGWSNSLYLNRHILVADLVDANTYYAVSYSADGSGGTWKSIDSGANWTHTSTVTILTTTSTGDANVHAVPNNQGHLLASAGTFYAQTGLYWTLNGGADNWNLIPNVSTCFQVAVGKIGAGKSYPSIFIAGILDVTADPTQTPGVFRSDNFDPANPTASPTWVRYLAANGSAAPAGNMDGPKSMCGDQDEYGTCYIGFEATGFGVLKLQ